jgi:hypothetical protein
MAKRLLRISNNHAVAIVFLAKGRILISEQRRKILISTGLQPGDDGRKTSESRFNGFGRRITR